MNKCDAQFSSTTLVVSNLEMIADFYKNACGLTEVARMSAQLEGREISEILFNFRGNGPASFVLLKYMDAEAPAPGSSINVFSTEDVEAFVSRAVRHGAMLVDPPVYNPEYGVKYGFIKDPEGHLVGAFEPSESSVGRS